MNSEIIQNPAEISQELRAKIVALESAMLKLPQIEIPILHHHAPGLYLREMRMPRGSVVTGKIHKTEHLCVLAQGSVIVVSESGRKHYSAPAVIHSMPGTKRALHALTDVVWINCHHNPTNERDEEKIDEIFVVDTFDQFQCFMDEKKQLEAKEGT